MTKTLKLNTAGNFDIVQPILGNLLREAADNSNCDAKQLASYLDCDVRFARQILFKHETNGCTLETLLLALDSMGLELQIKVASKAKK